MAFEAMAAAMEQRAAIAPDTTPVDSADTLTAISESRSCPAGHALKYAQAPGGACDGCLAKVPEGSLVSDCRQCNWYLCTTCTPITTCPGGHQLGTQPAMAGKCDGCTKQVPQGALAMNCSECNWYLCTSCQALMQCPKGHALKPWASQVSGQCDLCTASVKKGDVVADCRECNWFLCEACHPQLTTKASEQLAAVDHTTASPLPQCPQGHDAVPAMAGPGCSCDKCGHKIRQGGLASHCTQCNWALCAECHPIRQCKQGHKLEAMQAPAAGVCDGCGKRVHENQSVLDCRQCNWYLCGACHLPPAAGGAAAAS